MENLKRRALFREQLEKDSQEQEDEEGTEKSFVEGEDSEETAADDNELWDQDEVLVQVQVGAKRHDNRLKVLRRSFSEVTIAFGVHLAFLVYCTAVNVTDATVFKKCVDPDRVFVGHNTFGGRFKYLTHLFMWGFLVYYFLAFFTNIMPWSASKIWCHRLVDWLFTTVVWPTAWIVVILFWILKSIDMKLLGITEEFENYVPPFLDHAWHTFPVIIVTIETLLVYHRFPNNLAAAFSVFASTSGYIVWMLVVFTSIRVWPYPFLNHLNPFTFILFAAGCSLFCGLLYIFGKVVASLRWKERFQILYELSNETEQLDNDD